MWTYIVRHGDNAQRFDKLKEALWAFEMVKRSHDGKILNACLGAFEIYLQFEHEDSLCELWFYKEYREKK